MKTLPEHLEKACNTCAQCKQRFLHVTDDDGTICPTCQRRDFERRNWLRLGWARVWPTAAGVAAGLALLALAIFALWLR